VVSSAVDEPQKVPETVYGHETVGSQAKMTSLGGCYLLLCRQYRYSVLTLGADQVLLRFE